MSEALDMVLDHATSFQRERQEGQFNLFAVDCSPGQFGNLTDTAIADCPEWDEMTRLSFEKDLMGFYLSGHPLLNYQELVKKFTNASTSYLSGISNSIPIRMSGIVKKVKEINTRKGDRMAFVTIEDLEGIVEGTVFSDVYLASRDLINSGEPLIFAATRDGEPDAPKYL